MIKISSTKDIKGIIHIPASKSDAQRAILASALSNGTTEISNCGKSDDVLSMMKVVEQFGAELKLQNEILYVKGIQQIAFEGKYNVGESGLACRLLTPLFALHANQIEVAGKGTILNRNMHFFEQFFSHTTLEFKTNEHKLPFTINGELKGGEFELDFSESSQYLSGLLMALPLANNPSRIFANNVVSKPYVQMTLNTLRQFGIVVEHQNFEEFTISAPQKYLATNYHVEGDWSAASYWLVASALGMNIEVCGLNMASLQADKMILNAFVAAGCVIQNGNGIKINGEKRHAFEFDASDCPDLFPALVTFAALTEGTSILHGVHRLLNKESNRAKALQTEFKKIGVTIELVENSMKIYGVNELISAKVSSHHDHRIAMTLAIAGLFSTSGIEIEHAEAVNKSYPDFWEVLESLS